MKRFFNPVSSTGVTRLAIVLFFAIVLTSIGLEVTLYVPRVTIPNEIPEQVLGNYWTDFNTNVYTPVEPDTKVAVLQMEGWHMEIYMTTRPSIVYRWVLNGEVFFQYDLQEGKCVRLGDTNVKLTVTKDAFITNDCK